MAALSFSAGGFLAGMSGPGTFGGGERGFKQPKQRRATRDAAAARPFG